MGRGWRVGRIAGVDVRVDTSFLIIALFLTSIQFNIFNDRARFPANTTSIALGLAVLSAGLLFGSVLVHEMAHAAVYRTLDIEVVGVTLWMLGGYTQAKAEAPTPWQQFAVAGAGPAASLVLGFGFLIAHGSLPAGDVNDVLQRTGLINITLAIFNAIPAFPMDGGRLLRSVVWRVTGNLTVATTVSARIGQGFGVLFAAFGLYMGIAKGYTSQLWLAMIGLFLFQVATSVLNDERRRRALSTRTVGEVMSPPPPTVPADLTVAETRARFLDGHDGEAFPVMADGHVAGLVSLSTAAGVEGDRPVTEAMVDPDTIVEAGPDERMTAVTQRFGDRTGATVLVVEGGRLVGVVESSDLERVLRSHR
jgi:Zn-dependent protease